MRALHPARPSAARPPPRARPLPRPPAALSIDRKAHLEAAWARQAAQEASRSAAPPPPRGAVVAVDDAAHLDALAAAAGSQDDVVIVLFFYSRSCGTCREMRRVFAELAADAAASGARAVFLQHDVRDAFDEPSDLARLHRVRSVPTVLFLGGGAAVKRCALADSRVVAPSARGVGGARRWLRATLTEVLLRQAPSARR